MNEAQTTLLAWETQRQQHQSLWDRETEETKVQIVDKLASKILAQALSTLREAVSNPNYRLPSVDQPLILKYPISMANCSRLVLEVLPETSCVREWLRPHPRLTQQEEYTVDEEADPIERRALSVDREALDTRLAQLGSLCATRLWNKFDCASQQDEDRLGFSAEWVCSQQHEDAKLSRLKEPGRRQRAKTQQICVKLWLKEPALQEQPLPKPPKKRDTQAAEAATSEVIVVGQSENNGRKRGLGHLSRRK